MLTNPAHAENAKDDHFKMLTPMELMRVGRWVDSNCQFYGSYYGRQHSRWVEPDPQQALYRPGDFRRKATVEEAVSMYAPDWRR